VIFLKIRVFFCCLFGFIFHYSPTQSHESWRSLELLLDLSRKHVLSNFPALNIIPEIIPILFLDRKKLMQR
jgi:hypothetical protein